MTKNSPDSHLKSQIVYMSCLLKTVETDACGGRSGALRGRFASPETEACNGKAALAGLRHRY